MSSTTLAELVTSERESLLNGKDGIEDAVVTFARRAQSVAIGLLALGDVADAWDWLDALADEWVIDANNKFDAKYGSEPSKSAQLGPWEAYINAIYCAVLGRNTVEPTAETVLERTMEPFVDELENRSLAHRIDLARALSSYLLDTGTVAEHATALEDAVEERNKPWAVARYLPYARVLRGLDAGDVSEVEAGIEGLLEFHRNHVASARDADAVQKALALDATAMLALARRDGMAITVDHELIPDALNDAEHYPVGGT
ncbi:Imm49 family immunity protein [Natronoarchaeum rubrum]|uniref:Imm49 family immunity protein n=1 Tax=Natronoarchaeum rubrum TaxID=755311 RepID=UPI002111F649|nr:Imm49 family immunity protein [Natronoarchaeum rubrum]